MRVRLTRYSSNLLFDTRERRRIDDPINRDEIKKNVLRRVRFRRRKIGPELGFKSKQK